MRAGRQWAETVKWANEQLAARNRAEEAARASEEQLSRVEARAEHLVRSESNQMTMERQKAAAEAAAAAQMMEDLRAGARALEAGVRSEAADLRRELTAAVGQREIERNAMVLIRSEYEGAGYSVNALQLSLIHI